MCSNSTATAEPVLPHDLSPWGMFMQADWVVKAVMIGLALASIATCAGLYALRFCQERSIDTTGLSLAMTLEKNPEAKRISKLNLKLTLPPGFPEKYNSAIVRAMDQCAVKRHILEPPEFDISVEPSAS